MSRQLKTKQQQNMIATTIVGYYYKKARAQLGRIIDFVYPPKQCVALYQEATIRTRAIR